MTLVPFHALMERPDVVALADRLFADGSPPAFMSKFLALTMACSPVTPEQDLDTPTDNPDVVEHHGGVGSGCCLFWVETQEDGEGTGTYEPWTCALNLGASMSFVFQAVADYTTLLSEDDMWDGAAGDTAEYAWQQRTQDLLARSLWHVARDPASLGNS